MATEDTGRTARRRHADAGESQSPPTPSSPTEAKGAVQQVALLSGSVTGDVGSVTGDVLSIYIPTLSLIFFGCCSNVYTLESLISTDPSLGPLFTFMQFVFVSLFSSSSCLYVSSTAPFIHIKPRQVPVQKWLVYTILFMSVNLLNNSAFKYKISVPLHIILRSAGPVASMTVAYFFNKTRYSKVKVVAVAFLFVGVVLAALSDSYARSAARTNDLKLPADAGAAFRQQLPGFLIILLALILSAFLGLFTDRIYSQHGRSAQATAESLFYSHTLSIPFFVLHLRTLADNIRVLASSSPSLGSLVAVHTLPLAPASPVQQLLSSIPTAAVMLLLNALTQCLCISGVNRLATKSSSLTVSIVLNIRKLVSLLLSIWLFGNKLPTGVVAGAALVFLGGGLYAWPTGKGRPREKAGQNGSAEKKEL